MRTSLALILAAALSFCLGCGSSTSTNSAQSLAGTWTANIPAKNVPTPPTQVSAPPTSTSNTPPVTQMQFSFTLATQPTTPTSGTSSAPGTVSSPNSTPLQASALTVTSTANNCFDSNAQVTAVANKQASGNIQTLDISITENGNQMAIAANTTDGMNAFGNYNITGVTASCTSDAGTVSLTRNSSSTTTNPPTSPSPGTTGH